MMKTLNFIKYLTLSAGILFQSCNTDSNKNIKSIEPQQEVIKQEEQKEPEARTLKIPSINYSSNPIPYAYLTVTKDSVDAGNFTIQHAKSYYSNGSLKSNTLSTSSENYLPITRTVIYDSLGNLTELHNIENGLELTIKYIYTNNTLMGAVVDSKEESANTENIEGATTIRSEIKREIYELSDTLSNEKRNAFNPKKQTIHAIEPKDEYAYASRTMTEHAYVKNNKLKEHQFVNPLQLSLNLPFQYVDLDAHKINQTSEITNEGITTTWNGEYRIIIQKENKVKNEVIVDGVKITKEPTSTTIYDTLTMTASGIQKFTNPLDDYSKTFESIEMHVEGYSPVSMTFHNFVPDKYNSKLNYDVTIKQKGKTQKLNLEYHVNEGG